MTAWNRREWGSELVTTISTVTSICSRPTSWGTPAAFTATTARETLTRVHGFRSEQAGMGVGIGDYNLDGHLDLFKTHFMGDTSGFYRNDGKGNFDEVTRLAKVGVETRFTSWGAGIVDLDNDGYPDVFFVTGSVYPE